MGWRPLMVLVTVAIVGAASTLVVGVAVGMHGGELTRLGLLLVPALIVTVVAGVIARPLLIRSPMRQRMIATALVASTLSSANLTVLAFLMFVSREDAVLVVVLLLYSVAAAIGVALVQASSVVGAADRLVATAKRAGRRRSERAHWVP